MGRKKTVSQGTEDLALKLDNKYKLSFNKFELTKKQKDFLKIAFDKNTKIVFVTGPSGTSKTFSSIYAALQLYNMSNEYEIMYIRTIAESADKGLGSLPGSEIEKINPFMMPLMDKIEEIVTSTSSKMLLDKGIVSCSPVNYLRGASWKNKLVILDESQNYSFKELVTAITRIGENTKYFICGDLMQSDINGKSGLKPISEMFDTTDAKKQGIHVFKFEKEDILRSEVLKFIIGELEKNKK